MNTKVFSIISVCTVLNVNTDVMLENANTRKIYAVLYIPGCAYLNSELFYYNPVFLDRYHVSVWPAERPPIFLSDIPQICKGGIKKETAEGAS